VTRKKGGGRWPRLPSMGRRGDGREHFGECVHGSHCMWCCQDERGGRGSGACGREAVRGIPSGPLTRKKGGGRADSEAPDLTLKASAMRLRATNSQSGGIVAAANPAAPCCDHAVYHANIAGSQPYWTCAKDERIRELEAKWNRASVLVEGMKIEYEKAKARAERAEAELRGEDRG